MQTITGHIKTNLIMKKDDVDYMFDLLERIRAETHENNKMLKQIIRVINTYIANHHNENQEDFGRNVLANMISSGLGLEDLFKQRK